MTCYSVKGSCLSVLAYHNSEVLILITITIITITIIITIITIIIIIIMMTITMTTVTMTTMTVMAMITATTTSPLVVFVSLSVPLGLQYIYPQLSSIFLLFLFPLLLSVYFHPHSSSRRVIDSGVVVGGNCSFLIDPISIPSNLLFPWFCSNFHITDSLFFTMLFLFSLEMLMLCCSLLWSALWCLPFLIFVFYSVPFHIHSNSAWIKTVNAHSLSHTAKATPLKSHHLVSSIGTVIFIIKWSLLCQNTRSVINIAKFKKHVDSFCCCSYFTSHRFLFVIVF